MKFKDLVLKVLFSYVFPWYDLTPCSAICTHITILTSLGGHRRYGLQGERCHVGAKPRSERGDLQRHAGEGHQNHHQRAQGRHLLHQRRGRGYGLHGDARRKRYINFFNVF